MAPQPSVHQLQLRAGGGDPVLRRCFVENMLRLPALLSRGIQTRTSRVPEKRGWVSASIRLDSTTYIRLEREPFVRDPTDFNCPAPYALCRRRMKLAKSMRSSPQARHELRPTLHKLSRKQLGENLTRIIVCAQRLCLASCPKYEIR